MRPDIRLDCGVLGDCEEDDYLLRTGSYQPGCSTVAVDCFGYSWLGSEVVVHMPEVRYGGGKGKTIQLKVDPELVAVRARRGESLREGPVLGSEAALLNEMEPVLSFPEVSVEVYRRRERSSRSMEEVRKELHESPATRFAGRVLVDEQSREYKA